MPESAANAASADDRRRFLDQLPWWLNGTLAGADRAWMDEAVRRWPWAAQAAARERALAASLQAPEPAAADLGLQALLARVQDEAAPARLQPARVAATASWLERWLGWLAGPRLGPALALAVLAQAGVIGWLATSTEAPDSAMRSTPVTELRTLRVTVVPGLGEAQWRAALLAAGARIVGGPTQLGEYWLASDMRSLDEVQALLQARGVLASAEVDREGPRGR